MSMRKLTLGVVALGLMMGAAIAADKDDKKKKEEPPPPDPALTECVVPFRPAVVLDGKTATMEQLDELFARVKRYQSQLAAYRACLNPSMEAAQKSGDIAKDNEVTKQYNDSVTAEEQVVGAYNKVVEAFKAQQKLAKSG
jgi:hypothetical protein